MQVIALLATFNEERFIAACLENLRLQGVDSYLLDNDSTDRTVAIAEEFFGHGLIGIESIPRAGVYSWRPILERKEELAATLDGHWFMHLDADEIRLPVSSSRTIAEALSEVDGSGYNAVNFQEFTFTPTRESPEHDHREFQKTMRWYYPFSPRFPDRLNCWKKQNVRVDLGSTGGHVVRFPGLRMYPFSFPMRHYLFLSIAHAFSKYVMRDYDPKEVADGWHVSRVALREQAISLPSQSDMRVYTSDDQLDATDPRTAHLVFNPVEGPESTLER